MIILILIFFGLCLGSFINALVWRIHEQADPKKNTRGKDTKLSITKGRSMCPNCRHELATIDLIPVLSWISLKGKCRYCKKPINIQYPAVELCTATLFVGSYLWWPETLQSSQIALFIIWLLLIVGFVALSVYDLKWYILPNRIMYPVGVIALVFSAISIVIADNPLHALISTILAVLIGGGVFYLLFQLSGGKWIGGGDVRLGWLLGLVVATPVNSVLFIFLASLIGTVVSLPLLLSSRLKRNSTIPFGPFLMLAAFLVVLFGADMLDWYHQTFLNF